MMLICIYHDDAAVTTVGPLHDQPLWATLAVDVGVMLTVGIVESIATVLTDIINVVSVVHSILGCHLNTVSSGQAASHSWSLCMLSWD